MKVFSIKHGKLNIIKLYVEASVVARLFFEKFAFIMQRENEVKINKNVLVNYSMTVSIAIQSIGHNKETLPPAPFTGAKNALIRNSTLFQNLL